jgi:CRISPR-associated protein Cas6/Cse3/CasE subtype I-E
MLRLEPVMSCRCSPGGGIGAPGGTAAPASGPVCLLPWNETMNLVQLTIDLPAALDHAEKVTRLARSARQDTGLVIKTALTEALAGPVVRPWRLHATHGRTALVLGYSEDDAPSLRARLALALPSAQAAIGEIISSRVPALDEGAELAFEVRFSPVVSVNRDDGKGLIRRDAYLRARELAEAASEPMLSRDHVYRGYLGERLAGVELIQAALVGHRLERHAREGRGRWTIKSVPVVDMRGVVRITDAMLAQATLRDGIGRSKAFGCGMIRVAPASAARAAA